MSDVPSQLRPGAPGPGRFSTRKTLLFGAIASLVVGLAGLLLLEGAVRVRQWAKLGSMRSVEDTLTIDPSTGLRIPIPNKATGAIRINSRGFRSPELILPKPPGVRRLAFLGGSTTYCAEVSSNEMTWPHLVWQSLHEAAPHGHFDYVNAAAPGYGLDALLRTLQQRVRSLEPDVIVIYEGTNDLSADTRELALERKLVERESPFGESWPSRYSLLWFLVEKNVTIWRLQAAIRNPAGKLEYDPALLARGFERRLRELIRASQEAAPLVAVATFSPRTRRGQPPDVQREAATTALYYMPYLTVDGLIAGYEEYNRVVRRVAMQTGVLLIDGEDHIPADALHYRDSVHFTDAGSRAMASRVSDALLRAPAFQQLVTSESSPRARR